MHECYFKIGTVVQTGSKQVFRKKTVRIEPVENQNVTMCPLPINKSRQVILPSSYIDQISAYFTNESKSTAKGIERYA